MKKNVLTLLLFVFAITQAQVVDLEQVTISELEEKQHPLYPDAVAAVLFEKGTTKVAYNPSLGFQLETEILCKIKIYKSEGFRYATIQESFISESNQETVSFSKAFTYNLVNGKVEKTRLRSDGEFTDKINKTFSVKKITFPNVKEGSIIEYRLNVRSQILDRVKPWYFQKEIPVNYSQLTTTFPDYFVYSKSLTGYISPIVNTSRFNTKINDPSTYSYQSIPETREVYVMRDVEPLIDEGYSYNIQNYSVILYHELASYQLPNSINKSFSSSWTDVTKFVNKHDKFGKELNTKSYFESDLAPVITGTTNHREKLINVLEHAKSKVKWNGEYGVFCDKGVRNAYKNNTGNVAEVNLILTSMLRNAGFKANPILLSTRSNGIAVFPSINAFNYVIVGVELDNKVILLDATEASSSVDVIPLRANNWIGRLVFDNGDSKEINLDVEKPSNYQRMLNYKLQESGSIEGTYMCRFSDYMARLERDRYFLNSIDKNIELLENRYEGTDISDLEFQNLHNIHEAFGYQFKFSSSDYTDIVGNKMYINTLLFLATSSNPFTKETRKHPIDFPFPSKGKYIINIQIPDGYQVEYMPESIHVKMKDDIVTFRYLISQNGNIIQLNLQEDFNKSIIEAENYPDLKSIFENLIQKENEKIVLVKP